MNHYQNEYIDYRKGDCQELIKTLPDASVSIILTDPPYLYLKGQKLEREFDEKYLFSQWKRVLKPGGFVVMFGRGTSFYRWNYFLSELGFEFKEEIIWDKKQTSNPLHFINRHHETVAIYSKNFSKINSIKVPYLEVKSFDINAILSDIKRMKSILNDTKSFDTVIRYLENGLDNFEIKDKSINHKTIVGDFNGEDRCLTALKSIKNGMKERSIISVVRNHYSSIHPTEKPVLLLRRLLALVVKSKDDVVLDCFGGSGSTGEACIEEKLKCILFEIDDEYFEKSVDRLDRAFRNMDRQISLF